MNQIRDQLDDAIGVPPPPTIDVDALMARQRRRTTVRRWASAGGVAAAVLAIGVASALVLGGGSGLGGVPVGGPPSPPANKPHSAEPSTSYPGMPPGFEKPVTKCPKNEKQPNEVGARLGNVLAGDLAEVVPDAEAIDARGHPTRAWDFWHDCRVTTVDPGGNGGNTGADEYMARGDLKDSKGTGHLLVLVGELGLAGFSVETSCDDPAGETTDCHRQKGPNGEIVVSSVLTFSAAEGNADGAVSYRVAVTRKDGAGVLLEAQNWASNSATGKVSEPTRDKPPLTLDQLAALGLNPQLTL